MTVLRRVPSVVMANPERIFLKFAVVMIGVGILVRGPRSALSSLPTFVVYELGITFILGGMCALIGIVRGYRALERFGLAATAFGSATYALTLWLLLGMMALPTVTIFLGLALASITRLIVSSAAWRVVQIAYQRESS